MSVVRNAPVMSNTATSLILCASITDVIVTDYNATVRGVMSYPFETPLIVFDYPYMLVF